MVAPCLDIALDQGADFQQLVNFTQSDGVTPIDLSAYTGDMQVRDRPGGVLQIELTTANGRIATDSQGNVTMTIAAADTAALTPGRYFYNLRLISGENVAALLQGSFTVNAAVNQ
jgi:hypothetical protein